MADQKISELPDAGPPTDIDGFEVERNATTNNRLSWLNIRTALASLFEPAGAVRPGGTYVTTEILRASGPTGAETFGVPSTQMVFNVEEGIPNGNLVVGGVTTRVFDGAVHISDVYHTGNPQLIIQDEGTPVANQRPNLNFVGAGVLLSDNAGNDSTDINVSFIDALNVGTGAGTAGVYRDKTAGDPAVLNFRSIASADGSVIVTELADRVDLQATGAGGGQINSAQNIGAGAIDIASETNNGVLIPIRTMDDAVFNVTSDVIGIIPTLYAPQAATQAHIDDNNIHFAVSSLPGAGLVQAVQALAVGAGDGIAVATNDVAVDSTVARRNADNTFTGFLDATSVRVSGQEVYSPSNPPPGGSGIGVGAPFVVGDLLAVESATGGSETAESVGFAAADVARLSQASTFTSDQTVREKVIIESTGAANVGYVGFDGATNLRLLGSSTNLPANLDVDVAVSGRIVAVDAANALTVTSQNQASLSANGGGDAIISADGTGDVRLNSAAGVVNVTSGELQEAGARVYSPNNEATLLKTDASRTLGADVGNALTWRTEATSFTPSPLVSNAVRITGAATVSAMTVPGFVYVSVDSGVTVDVTAFDVRGTEGSGVRDAYIVKDDSAATPRWHWTTAA